MRRRCGRKGIVAVLLAIVIIFLIVPIYLLVWGEGKEVSNTAKIVELKSVRIVDEGDTGLLSAGADGNQSGEEGGIPGAGFSSAAVTTPEPHAPSSTDSTLSPEVLPIISTEPVSSGESASQEGQNVSEPEEEPGPVIIPGDAFVPETAQPEGINPSPAAPDVQEAEMIPGGAGPEAAPAAQPYDGGQGNTGISGQEAFAEMVPMDTPEPADASNAGFGQRWKVTFYLPYIALSYDVEGVVYSDIREVSPSVYKNVDVEGGAALDKPWNPIVFMTPFGYTTAKADISFEGWCTSDGVEWDFEQNVVWADTELYPVWVDSGGNRYYTVIYSAPEAGFYCCNCLKEGSVGYERPGSGFSGYSMPQRGGYLLAGWEKKNQGNAFWGAGTEVVDGFEILSAVWLPLDTDAYVAAYTTGTGENGYGDLVDVFLVEPGGSCPAPVRPLSDGIVLPEGAQGGPVDWLNESGSYRDVTAEGGNRFYTFRAFWGVQGE